MLRRKHTTEAGITFIEIMIASFIMTLTILISLQMFRVLGKGLIVTKNNLRANTLALSKMEDMRNAAVAASYAGSFKYLTNSAMAISYSAQNLEEVGNSKFTWRVTSEYIYQTWSAGVMTVMVSGTATNMLRLNSWVGFRDTFGSKQLTMTGYAVNYRQ